MFFLRDHANAQGRGPVSTDLFGCKLEFYRHVLAHIALQLSLKLCKTAQSKAILRASSQSLGLGSFAAIEFPIFLGGVVDTGL